MRKLMVVALIGAALAFLLSVDFQRASHVLQQKFSINCTMTIARVCIPTHMYVLWLPRILSIKLLAAEAKQNGPSSRASTA